MFINNLIEISSLESLRWALEEYGRDYLSIQLVQDRNHLTELPDLQYVSIKSKEICDYQIFLSYYEYLLNFNNISKLECLLRENPLKELSISECNEIRQLIAKGIFSNQYFRINLSMESFPLVSHKVKSYDSKTDLEILIQSCKQANWKLVLNEMTYPKLNDLNEIERAYTFLLPYYNKIQSIEVDTSPSLPFITFKNFFEECSFFYEVLGLFPQIELAVEQLKYTHLEDWVTENYKIYYDNDIFFDSIIEFNFEEEFYISAKWLSDELKCKLHYLVTMTDVMFSLVGDIKYSYIEKEYPELF